MDHIENDAINKSNNDMEPVINTNELTLTNNAKDAELSSAELNLSSLNSDDLECQIANKEDSCVKDNRSENEVLYRETVLLMQSKEIDVESGIKLLKRCAQSGYAAAWLYLGQLYSNNKSSLYNPALAFDCYKRAAEMECAEGYYNLGLCYNTGLGCEKNADSAVDCFSQGAKQYDPKCICALGICYEFGIGCQTDYERAVIMYEKAAQNDDAVAINNLGGCYFYGHGVSQDKQSAISLYRRAAELGNSNAECRLGICCELGDGCEQDLDEAFLHYQAAAKAKNPHAMFRLANCYDNGIGTDQNFAKAFKYYSRAAEGDSAVAMYRAGMMSMIGRGTKKSSSVAYKMLSGAAEQGFAPAEYEVANCLFEGIGTVRNRKGAYLHYCETFEGDGDNAADAAFRIGLCHLKGLGVEKDEHKAFEWFSKGSELQSVYAMYMMGECYRYGIGTDRNNDAAANAFVRAVKLTDEQPSHNTCVFAILALAQCFEGGIGVTQDSSCALELYKRAADFGLVEAMFHAARVMISNERPDYSSARPYMLRAARKGFAPAMLHMGMFADEGKGVRKNQNDARGWYAKAISASIDQEQSTFDFPERYAETKDLSAKSIIDARYRLGMLIPECDQSTQSYIEAFENISLAAAAGHRAAQDEVARIYLYGGDLKNYYENRPSRKKANFGGPQDSPDETDLANSLNKLGDAFFDGKGLVKKNESAAAKCYKTAAELDQNDACYSYGWCLRHGVGVKENDVEAAKWLKKSADRGNINAAYSYGLCCEEGVGTGVRNKREALYYYRLAAASGHAEAAERYMLISERA